jgi:hypothetical protein
MAVAFPFDQLTSKPGAAMNKLQTALNKVIAKLNQKVAEAISKSNILPKNISKLRQMQTNNPRDKVNN